MAIFRLPPSPFIGGRQPLDPGPLPPAITAVPEDNPPFGLKTGLWSIISAWQEPFPRQASRFLPQELVVVNDPPFSGRNHLSGIIDQWQPDPGPQRQQGKHVPVSVSAVPEDNPPFSQRSHLPVILGLWQPDQGPQRQRGVQTTQVPPAVNDPPFSMPGRAQLSGIIDQWQPDQGPQRQQSPGVPVDLLNVVVVADFPPGGPSKIASIIAAWQPLPLKPPEGRHLPIDVTLVPVIGKLFVPVVKTKDDRLNRFSEIVAQIFNSLIRQEMLEKTGQDDWSIVGGTYTTNDPTSWASTPPATYSEALDRIAALLKALNGGTGP
jgi:hypothetical protein